MDAVELVRWCSERRATIRWGDLVSLEVLAPGTSWLMLRGEGTTIERAFSALQDSIGAWERARARYEGSRVARRPVG